MVQTALETVDVQQFAVHRQGVSIPLLTQRQIPTVQTSHTLSEFPVATQSQGGVRFLLSRMIRPQAQVVQKTVEIPAH